MTNEQELAKIISYTRKIETILKEKFQAKGKGLHTYLDSIESSLDSQLVKNLRYIATIRNKSMHESSFKVDNFQRYENVAKNSIIKLNNSNTNRRVLRSRQNNNSSFFGILKSLALIMVIFFLVKNQVGQDNNRVVYNETPISQPVVYNIEDNEYKNNIIKVTNKSNFHCQGKIYCSQMSSCEEAKFYINNCPNTKMDGDGDGIPCRRQWCD